MIKLYEPKLEDLWFKEKLLNDEQTMSYNHTYGGTISFPREKWEIWYDKWIINHENYRSYRYVKLNNIFIGECAYHYDFEKNIYLIDIIIYNKYRNNGYRKLALKMLCDIAKSNGIKTLYDEIAIDNTSINLFLKCGFEKVLETNEYILVKKDL